MNKKMKYEMKFFASQPINIIPRYYTQINFVHMVALLTTIFIEFLQMAKIANYLNATVIIYTNNVIVYNINIIVL